MKAVRLHGARDLRLEDVPEPPAPGQGEVLIKVTAVGICGSDLHTYQDGRIGDSVYETPGILGHEFAGEVVAVGAGAIDGHHQPLKVGQRVAVDPAVPDYEHEQYEKGHPNLCPKSFYGLYPEDGALRECMLVHDRCCFPIPDSISDGGATLLETLGVAIHAIDLAKIRITNTVAVIGCGPVGLLIARLATLAGAGAVYAFDLFSWRVEKAKQWGVTDAWQVTEDFDPAAKIDEVTHGRGVDVVIEAAWSDHSVAQAAEMSRTGGRLVLVGIPGDDRLQMPHSTARRKGLTIMLSRRMKHTYPRAIQLVTSGLVDVDDLISHHFPLEQTPEAFKLNAAYGEGIHKIIVDVG